jgi:hypothetical protein
MKAVQRHEKRLEKSELDNRPEKWEVVKGMIDGRRENDT